MNRPRLSQSILGLSAVVLAACAAGGGGAKTNDTGAVKDDGTRGTPLIALGKSLQDQGKCDAPAAGTPPIRRITRIEYNNAIADLFNVTEKLADGFVPEEKTGVTIGFNTNIRATVSPLAVEQYLAAAEKVADSVFASAATVTGCAGVNDAACIKNFITARARRAFRGTLPEDEKTQLLADYDKTAADLGAEAALRFGVEAVLLSPRFLYTVEIGAGTQGIVPLTGAEVAGRLASFLWRSVPDEALLSAADAGELSTAEGVTARARAMLDDPRAAGMLADYARQWLDVEQTPSLTRDNMVWPDFTPDLEKALLAETEQFFTAVASGDAGSYADLLTADYTMGNAAVAQFYGISPPAGGGFEKLSLPPERRGVLTQASMLATHAHFARPSIVLRGKLVRFQLLCDPIDPPPPAVDTTLKPVDAGKTEREAAEAHASNAACIGCHTRMDPIGFVFGKFDAVGKYHPDNGEDIAGNIAPPKLTSHDDVSGLIADPAELGTKLAQSEHAQQCYVIQSLRYALGREEVTGDACSAASAWEHFASHGLGLKELVVAITGTDTFRHRTSVIPGEACQ